MHSGEKSNMHSGEKSNMHIGEKSNMHSWVKSNIHSGGKCNYCDPGDRGCKWGRPRHSRWPNMSNQMAGSYVCHCSLDMPAIMSSSPLWRSDIQNKNILTVRSKQEYKTRTRVSKLEAKNSSVKRLKGQTVKVLDHCFRFPSNRPPTWI